MTNVDMYVWRSEWTTDDDLSETRTAAWAYLFSRWTCTCNTLWQCLTSHSPPHQPTDRWWTTTNRSLSMSCKGRELFFIFLARVTKESDTCSACLFSSIPWRWRRSLPPSQRTNRQSDHRYEWQSHEEILDWILFDEIEFDSQLMSTINQLSFLFLWLHFTMSWGRILSDALSVYCPDRSESLITRPFTHPLYLFDRHIS